MPDGSVKAPMPAAPERPEVRLPEERPAAALAPLPPLQLADGEHATILTLRDSMCKWPIGDPADPKFAFCGRKADCGPYCAEHAKVAFQPARKRDARKGEYDYVRRIAG
ncbi:MAG: GcrA family cell cycle regulator [Hyphomonas sp.]